MSYGASALSSTIPAASGSLPGNNFTSAAQSSGTDSSSLSRSRRKRFISQNDMLAILDYHNKVRGKVFPPAANMEYMVSESFDSFICVINVHVFPLNLVCLFIVSWTVPIDQLSQKTVNGAQLQQTLLMATLKITIHDIVDLLFLLCMFC